MPDIIRPGRWLPKYRIEAKHRIDLACVQDRPSIPAGFGPRPKAKVKRSGVLGGGTMRAKALDRKLFPQRLEAAGPMND